MIETRLFLWNGKALYVGQGLESTLHQHHAVQIGISLAQPFNVRCHLADGYMPVQGFIANPNMPHQIDAADTPSIFLWLEATSEIARTLYHRPSTQCLQPVPAEHCQLIQTLLRSLQEANWNCSAADVMLNNILHSVSPMDAVSPALDERVRVAVERLQQSDLPQQIRSIEQLAGGVHLSPSRLRHLFQDQLGISIQRYLLWQRLLVALKNMTEGVSLTQAAYTAGFADAAHMTRTFRKMFGIKPSDVFKDSHSVQVIFCEA